jgi:hypothetical protein
MARRPAKTRRGRKVKRRVPAGRRSRRPVEKPDPLDDFIVAGARLLRLKVRKSWRPAVRGHLQVTLRHGERVQGFALPDDSEPAPVFEP